MGAQYSGLNGLKKNEHLKRLADVESIDENDPFWNQLLSFSFNLPFTKENSKLLDETIALFCQSFHQNNPKSGNYGSLIRVFCRRSIQTREMSDNHLMTLQTANALLIIRCFTKYIIEIENEAALLEQINSRANILNLPTATSPTTSSSKLDESSSWHDLAYLNRSATNHHHNKSLSSISMSPRRYRYKNKYAGNQMTAMQQRDRDDDSPTDDLESDPDSVNTNNYLSSKKNEGGGGDDETGGDNDIEEDTLYELISSIIEICIKIPVEQHTYFLHFEALNTLLILLSVQMFTKVPTHESYIYETFMHKMDKYIASFVKSLLRNIIQQMPAPVQTASPQTLLLMASQNQNSPQQSSSSSSGGGGSLFSSMASGLWTVMTLGMASSSSTSSKEMSTDNSPQSSTIANNSLNNKQIVSYLPSFSNDAYSNTNSPNPYDTQLDLSQRLLAWQSCHILLVLTNHCTHESLYNPYRLALFHFTDTQDTPTNIPNSEPLPWFSIDYTKLFQMFTFTLNYDQYTLLLYMLLHRNQHFKMFILSRINIDLLIIPILKVVFNAPNRSSHHIYMALIILLILSEDDLFNKSIHNISIKRLTWYNERMLSEISLGGLLTLVVIRTIQFNMTRMRDKYLHTNCLAALANMSSKFCNLHPYVCQRINSLFNLLVKKRTKIINTLNLDQQQPPQQSQDASAPPAPAAAAPSDTVAANLVQDLAIIEELMRMVLEIMNSCLINAIHHNSNLVYSILYYKAQFLQFRTHPSFQDVIQNIDLVIAHFSNEIDHIEDKSMENIKEVIDIGVRQFSRERFKKFPELKFKYVEEDQPEDFFVPYVWSLVYKSSNLYWIDHTSKPFDIASASATGNMP